MNWLFEPLPNGAVVEVIDPYRKTVRFERHTDSGTEKCDPPKDYTLRDGYKLAR